jgi:hypothetical protein
MRNLLFFILISLFFYSSSQASEYWSNKKIYPTSILGAETFIKTKQRELEKEKKVKIDYPALSGIWYAQNLGYVGIYQDKNDLNSFKMFLIKAPKGFGLSAFPGYEPEKIFKANKDHEGTWEATITGFKNLNSKSVLEKVYLINSKFWSPQNDGSYEYKNLAGSIEMFSDTHFKLTDELRERGEFFIKMDSYKWMMAFINAGISKRDLYEIYDLEIELNSKGAFIYLDTKVKNKVITDKFISIDYDGSVATGKIKREIDNESNTIDSIQCTKDSSLIYLTQFTSKLINNNCDPKKITYSTYWHYKNRGFYWVVGIFIIALILNFILKRQRKRKLLEHNKKNKNKFNTYTELKLYKLNIQEIEDKKREKKYIEEQKREERKEKAEQSKFEKQELAEQRKLENQELAEQRKLEKQERSFRTRVDLQESTGESGLMTKIQRLKRLYENGTLSKAEFEKAKNKLLK